MSRPRIQRERAPDGITPLVGYRSWMLSVGPTRSALHSLNRHIVHEVNLDGPLGQRADPWLVARCLRKNHDAPEESCSCGFYAVKRLSTLARLLPLTAYTFLARAWAKPEAATFPVAGRVDLAGKIVEHALGYRAERMRIVELHAFGAAEEPVARFARQLGVPIGEPILDPAGASTAPGSSVPGSVVMGGGHERDPLTLSLTPREVEVLSMLASGMGTEEVVQKLHVNSATIRSMLDHLLQKAALRTVTIEEWRRYRRIVRSRTSGQPSKLTQRE